ncbi:MAG TPA: NAD(P)H-hydrate dehydratase [Candidatus Methylomirabilis sp.]|jgi:NAD(P)H-hydrate epimerase|nr:NAD(P)H-hydrate dehydratase [Candidatus Methylomirabilis sp.]
MKVVTAKEMRELDRRATDEYGVPSLLLMENAGAAVAAEVERRFGPLGGKRILVCCGKGNNGGDGFVAARHLHNRGAAVRVLLCAKRSEIAGDPRLNLQILEKTGLSILPVETAEEVAGAREAMAASDLLLDALLGTGLTGAAKGVAAGVIAAMNEVGQPVVALDLPSGLASDDGILRGPHVRAACTITFALPKRSLFLYPAAAAAGEVVVADIGMPAPLLRDPGLPVEVLEAADMAAAFPPRDPNAHKGTYGHVLVVAGSVGKSGAAALCSLGALRSGAGLVTLALPESLNDAMEAKLTEVMTVPLPETEERTLSRAALDRLLPLLEGKAAVALGPGLSTHPSTVALVWDLIAAARLPLVVDADGVNALAHRLEALGKVTAPLLLTPHPGELARLLTVGPQEVQDQRIPIAQKVAQTYNLTLVLKGARTVVANPKGQVAISPTGNPGMATAGAGDVLTGVLAGLIAQGGDLDLKVRAGVYLHGLAGDLAAEALTAEAMLAGDLLTRLPEAIRRLKGK